MATWAMRFTSTGRKEQARGTHLNTAGVVRLWEESAVLHNAFIGDLKGGSDRSALFICAILEAMKAIIGAILLFVGLLILNAFFS